MANARMGLLIEALKKMLDQASILAMKKPRLAEKSDNAKTLQGLTIAQHKDRFAQETVTPHVEDKSRPHVVTPAQVGSYSREETVGLLSSVMNSDDSAIFSYGKPNDYPLDVSGSYDSTLRIMKARHTAMCYEVDGTLSILRGGTDGGTEGVFLAYVPDVLTASIMKPVYTNQRYHPAYFTAEEQATRLLMCGQGVIMGWGVNTRTGAEFGFISLMNGTMDGANHTGVKTNRAVVIARLNRAEPVLVPQGVLLIGNTYGDDNTPFDLPCSLIPINLFSAVSGAMVTATSVPVTRGVDFYNQNLGPMDAIRLTPTVVSASMADKPFCFKETADITAPFNFSGGGITTRSVYDPASGTVFSNLLYAFRPYGPNGVGETIIYFQLAFEITLNTAATSLTWRGLHGHAPSPSIAPLNLKKGAIFIEGSGNAWMSNLGQMMYGITSFDRCWEWTYDGKGNAFYFMDEYYPWMADTIVRQDIYDSANVPRESPSAALRPSSTNRRSVNVAKYGVYPSALGVAMSTPILTPWGWMCYAFGDNSAGAASIGFVRFEVGAQPTFTPDIVNASNFKYKSLNRGEMYGWTPAVTRQFVAELKPGKDYRGMVATYDVGKSTPNGAAPCVLGSNFRLSSGGSMDANGDFVSDAFSMTAAQMKTLKDTMLQRLGKSITLLSTLEIIPLPGLAIGSSYYTLALVYKDTDNSLQLAVGKGYGPGPGSLLVASVGTPFALTGATDSIPNGSVDVANGCTYSVVKMGDGTHQLAGKMAQGVGPSYATVAHSAIEMRCILDSSGDLVDGTTRGHFAAVVPPGSSGQCYVPGWGWTVMLNQDAQSDYLSKIVLAPVTNFQNRAYVDNNVNNRVLAGLQVASQWTFSFNQNEPCVLNGKYVNLPPWTVDLAGVTASPGNKTFYVYANPTLKKYEAFATVQEDPTRLYIGTVVTNQTQIESINIDKVIGFGNARLSTTPRGASIPVSAGLPSRPGSLMWK